MAQRRDSVRGSPAESPATVSIPGNARRFARLVSGAPVMRRVAVGRIVLFGSLGVMAVALLAMGGLRVVRAARDYLRSQQAYTLEFHQIELDPPPPPWVRSGAAGLLKKVHDHSGRPEVLRVLDLDVEALAHDFEQGSPWVRSVRAVELFDHNHVVVRLSYRQPCAYIWPGQGQKPATFLDEDGAVLPADDLSLSVVDSLIGLEHLAPGNIADLIDATQPGEPLRIRTPDGTSAPNRVRQATRLASFLLRTGATASPPQSILRVRLIHGGPIRIGFSIETQDRAMIVWGAAPGFEPPDSLSAARKWAILSEWLEQHRLADYPGERCYLQFEQDHIVVKPRS